MAVYAIGDIQGCRQALDRLLQRISFSPEKDRLWFTGDLVSRGPDSLGVLRLVKGLGDSAIVVLGNHDLHLLAAAAGAREANRTLAPVLRAPDREALLAWLQARPLLHHEPDLGVLVHAGLPPQWDLATAQMLAREVEASLRGPESSWFFHNMYGDRPELWSESLADDERLRYAVNALTRIRYVTKDGRLNFDQKGPPSSRQERYLPWFQFPARATSELRIVFGHWSTLGILTEPNLIALDSGCVWGGRLTAFRLDRAEQPVTVKC